jgi:hypothetical protein
MTMASAERSVSCWLVDVTVMRDLKPWEVETQWFILMPRPRSPHLRSGPPRILHAIVTANTVTDNTSSSSTNYRREQRPSLLIAIFSAIWPEGARGVLGVFRLLRWPS